MKSTYNGINFDSDLEIKYFKYLEELKEKGEIYDFFYHPFKIKLTDKINYEPDFLIIEINGTATIIETKGYNQFSFAKDRMIHELMKNYSPEQLKELTKVTCYSLTGNYDYLEVSYKKIKYLNNFGWVDFDFKNPNTLSNQRKEKVKSLEMSLKQALQRIRNLERYILYAESKKLSKSQLQWFNDFRENDVLFGKESK